MLIHSRYPKKTAPAPRQVKTGPAGGFRYRIIGIAEDVIGVESDATKPTPCVLAYDQYALLVHLRHSFEYSVKYRTLPKADKAN